MASYTARTSCSPTAVKPAPLGKHSRISPLVFPLPPRRHGWRDRAKQNTAPVACSTFSKSANSIPRSRITVRLPGCLRSAPIPTSATSRLACAAQRPPESRPLLRSTSVTRHAPAPLPTTASPSRSPSPERSPHDLGTLPDGTGARDLATPFLRPAPPVPAFAFMTQTRPDSTAGTRQAGWIKPPLVDRPVDRGRKDHQSRPFDRDPARDPPGRPMLPHDKTPHKPRPSLAVEDPGPHAGNPSGLAATLGGRCTMAPPRANGERVSGHLLADGRFVSARRSGHPAAAPRASATRFPRARPRQGGRTGPWGLPIPGCRKQTPSYREPMGPHHPQALHQQ